MMPKILLLIFLSFLILTGCAHLQRDVENHLHSIAFFVVAPGFAGAEQGDAAVRSTYDSILSRTGHASPWGHVGIALNYPYTAFLTGSGPNQFELDGSKSDTYERLFRIAHEMKIQVLVGLNGGPWAEPEGPFNAFWKTAHAGKYLSRYQDGRLNEAITEQKSIPPARLQGYLKVRPYDLKTAPNALILTLSGSPKEFEDSRRTVLRLAVEFWKKMDAKYPGTLAAFTTDSEVCDTSFRSKKNGDLIPVGFEDSITKPYCTKYQISSCSEYFKDHVFTYDNPEDLRWFEFRSEIHRQFVKVTVDGIREFFPDRAIYTHQLGTPDGVYINPFRKYDVASPQKTAFVDRSFPGITAYIYEKADRDFWKIIGEFSQKAKGSPWGLMEFNPGKAWKGSKKELEKYTYETLSKLYDRRVSAINFLSWETNSLDAGIKDSGVDSGIMRFLTEGPRTKK